MRKPFSALALAMTLVFLMATIAHAAAVYHGSWSTRPLYGNWWWYNNDPTSGHLTWYVDDWWSTDGVNALRKYHKFPYYYEFRLEQEAYNPGGRSQCDRLGVYSYDAMSLPITGVAVKDGDCTVNSPNIKELVEWYIDEDKITSATWYRHRVTYNKHGVGTGGDGEVNYSWSRAGSPSDDWLGKVVYDQWFNKQYSDPTGLVN